ncbi:50S ribosomal protein L7/L12 [Thraustotheca clavata]|uniref:50S ribosomal protein L7/L12 n=1 Tax=Thraustotheca clavata TaxID=74557 RepID=A0A1V9Z0C7_9STRA|nr:50S ribosomal protein L7/L12 [Thraustotheca clavata]
MLARVLRSSATFTGRRAISSSFPRFSEEKELPVMQPRVQRAFDLVVDLSSVEIAELAQALQEKFEIPEMGIAIGGSGADAGAAVEEVKEEKTSFDVKLVSYDAKSKIKVIKEIRAITGLGLKEAKELVEGVPAVLKKDVKKAEADELLAKIAEMGGVGELE